MVETRRKNKATLPTYIYRIREIIWMLLQMTVENEIAPKVDLYLDDNDLLQVSENNNTENKVIHVSSLDCFLVICSAVIQVIEACQEYICMACVCLLFG